MLIMVALFLFLNKISYINGMLIPKVTFLPVL